MKDFDIWEHRETFGKKGIVKMNDVVVLSFRNSLADILTMFLLSF